MKNYKYWIALDQAKGIGPASLQGIYKSLTKSGLSITDLFDLNAAEIKEELHINDQTIAGIMSAKESLPRIEETYYQLLDSGVETTLFFEETYPSRFIDTLKNTFPPVIYSIGNKSILKDKGVAVLGESSIGEKGESITYMAAKELARHNIVTISGLAGGADTTAHRSALENAGKTAAILPYGIMNLKIPDALKYAYDPERMLMMSALFPTAEYSKYNAYNRNRLICALSCAVYLVESTQEGGIFEAAKSAHKLNIPLFTTQYAEYPKSASANKKLIEEFKAAPVKGRMINNELTPNMDKLIGIVKYK